MNKVSRLDPIEDVCPDPLPRFLGLTWVGWLNFLILRWFFVRLFYVVEKDSTISHYGLLKWIWPMPWRQFRFVGKGPA